MGKCYSCCSSCSTSFRAKFRPSRETEDETLKDLEKTKEDEADAKPGETTTPLIPVDEQARLVVEKVDLCSEANGISHRTFNFISTKPRLIIRRGDDFKLKLHLNREFNPEKDVLCLVFILTDTKKPSYSQETLISVPVQETSDDTSAWKSEIVVKNGNVLTLQVTSSSSAIVGEWKLEIDTKDLEDKKTEKYVVQEPIYMLFNPWCAADTVYMPDEEWRNEYVLNDNGAVWRGSYNRIRPCMWSYGQYEENVLECCCYLLSKVGNLRAAARSDPIRVSRHLSAVVNSADDNGLIEGRWDNNYKKGIPPTHWAGSKSILQKYFRTKKPVKYGQCWVFAAVLTTVSRVLGIPARPVTNFSSAHDTQNSLTIDNFFDKDGDALEELNTDSIWNFHVWTEMWFARPDLEPGDYGGWQAVDATPQEESEDMFRCGPASIAAIKRGEVLKPYDNPFIFAEVNADKVDWFYHGVNQPFKLIQMNSDSIGRFISTKALGSYDREDVTLNYKHEEGSREEREIMLIALRNTKNKFSRYYLNDEMEDVEFSFQLLDDIVIGSSFNVKLTAKNKSPRGYTVNAVLRVDTVFYTGKIKNLVKKESFKIKCEPGTEEVVTMTVTYSDYQKELMDQCAFNIAAMATVVETDFHYFAQDDFRVRMPDVKIETEGDFVEGQEFTAHVSLKNPLLKPLHKGFFFIEGPGLGEPIKLKIKNNTAPGLEARVTCRMTPKTPGEKNIIAKYHSKEIDEADGFKTIIVKPQIEKASNGQ